MNNTTTTTTNLDKSEHQRRQDEYQQLLKLAEQIDELNRKISRERSYLVPRYLQRAA